MQLLLEVVVHGERVYLDLVTIVTDVDAKVLPRDQFSVQAAMEYLLVECFTHI